MTEHVTLRDGLPDRVDPDEHRVWHPGVLVVEDNAVMRDGLMRALRRQVLLGPIRGASDGLEGLRIARARRPEVLLIDRRLPSLSGLDVVRSLQQSSSEARTAVVLMTASPDAELRAAAAELEVFAVVDKASDRRHICETVIRASQDRSA